MSKKRYREPCIVYRCPKCERFRNVVTQKTCCEIVLIDVAPNKQEILEWQRREEEKENVKEMKREWTFKRHLLRGPVLERDSHKCVRCQGTEELQVHHIKALADGGNNEMNNLETLCYLCHMGEHEGENVYNLMMGNFFKQEVV